MRISPAKILIVSILCWSQGAHADGTLVSWSPDTIAGMTKTRWDGAKELDTTATIDRVRSAHDWATAYEGLLAASSHTSDKDLLKRLVAEVSNPAEPGLSDTSRLIIWQRITSDDIIFEGRGLVVEDDLFRVAGRANWILRTLLHKTFGFVKPTSTQAELDTLRRKWESHLKGENVAEETPAYPSEVKGLTELRSVAAIAALVHSLHPTPEKDLLTKTCLRNLYGLDELPTAPESPALLCSPDTYTHRYLAAMTDVPDHHTPEWWDSWWHQHGGSLGWDSERAKFLTSPP